MNQIGEVALVFALLAAVYVPFSSIIGERTGRPWLRLSGRRSVLVVCGLTTLAALSLIYALLTRDFRLAYVANYSSTDLSIFYTISALWAGQAGSMLLWVWVLSIFAAIVVYQTQRKNTDLAPYVLAVMAFIQSFFLALLVFADSPFRLLATAPLQGAGMNPMLTNPGMFFHPTTLYIGYVGFTVPFAFCIAALITGKLGDQWITSTRRWTLFAWAFLTFGILLGAWWAYNELGWGGYWAWDPVESASFMPWLVATAYLHSVMIQERRGMLKMWNVGLIIGTFLLTIFGTFLTRSGVLNSVHAFADTDLGPMFLGLIAFLLVGSLGLVYYRRPELKQHNEIDSFLCRESSFLFNNVILVGIAFAVFLGTIFPILSEAVRGVKITVGPAFFNAVTAPLFMALIALMGICPLIGWRRASRDNLIRNFLYPLGLAGLVVVLLLVFGIHDAPVLLGFGLTSFVMATILLEIFRGVRARRQSSGKNLAESFRSLVWGNKRRYGGYLVHLGVIILVVGIIASSVYQVEKDVTLKVGESATINGYTVTYRGLDDYPTATREVVTATLDVYNSKQQRLAVLNPSKVFTSSDDSGVAEVAIRSTLAGDLYTVLNGWDQQQTITLKLIDNPLVDWIWLGGLIMIFGTGIAGWPDARERKRDEARLAEIMIPRRRRELLPEPLLAAGEVPDEG